jgi:hypothetical protein
MMAAIEAGYRVGRKSNERASEPARAHVNAIQASLLGVLALLLGFTFSLALQRFDSRSHAVVEEANAIGTAYLRAQLLPADIGLPAQAALSRYLDLRVASSGLTLVERAERAALRARTLQAFDELWSLAKRAADEDGRPVTAGLFVQALNDVADAHGTRDAELDRHVPELVLFLLFGTFLLTGGIVGYASGVSGHRASGVSYLMVVLIVVLVFIIIDLDRPRRGLIEVGQQSLLDLQASMEGR